MRVGFLANRSYSENGRLSTHSTHTEHPQRSYPVLLIGDIPNSSEPDPKLSACLVESARRYGSLEPACRTDQSATTDLPRKTSFIATAKVTSRTQSPGIGKVYAQS